MSELLQIIRETKLEVTGIGVILIVISMSYAGLVYITEAVYRIVKKVVSCDKG